MKIYLVIHEANEEFKAPFLYEILSSYLSKEKAMEELKEIADNTDMGLNMHFSGMNPKRIQASNGIITYEWISDADETCFTHYRIVETELKS